MKDIEFPNEYQKEVKDFVESGETSRQLNPEWFSGMEGYNAINKARRELEVTLETKTYKRGRLIYLARN